MTRELKFRAWVKEKKEWFYTDLEITEDDFCCNEIWLDYENCTSIEQYTGLKDKNGKEIYEGDIIEVETCIDEEETTIYEVYWDEDTLEYALKTIKGVNYDSCVGELSQSAIKVIANIHENPELLGGKQ